MTPAAETAIPHAPSDVGVKVLWTPPKGQVTEMDKFREKINTENGLHLSNYQELYAWSVAYHDKFWGAMWEYGNVQYSQKYSQVIDTSITMDQVPEWFKGARLNYAENALRWNDDQVALIGCNEGTSDVRKVTYRELRNMVARFAQALKRMGISNGDRVTGYMPNTIEAAVAMLAASSIGAIWSGTSPDFGVNGVLDRFSQIKPSVLISVNGVYYNGKVHDHVGKLKSVIHGLHELRKIIILPFVKDHPFDLSAISPMAQTWDDFVMEGNDHSDAVPELHFEQLPFNHPLFIMYSSGTTGAPKCMVHSAGGCMIKHLEEHILQGDLKRQDTLFYYTTTGWMMWNWLLGGLLVGATLVVYDGSPFKPTMNSMWDLVDKLGITVFGTSAKWIATCMDNGMRPMQTHSLKTMRAILSTGSPLTPDSFEYVYSDVKSDVLLGSISGGTDICSCFMGSNPTVPVVKGEIQTRHLGMAVEAWDDDGHPVFDVPGELVCTKPFPAMPVCFWNDPDGCKYRAAYFDKFPGVWAHGDFCQINSKTGGVLMLGRSDGVLNPSGVRFGSAEIYNIIEKFEQIEDSLCVGQVFGNSDEERVVLFLKMREGHEFGKPIIDEITKAIRAALSPRHIPHFILETKAIPYTINGKKVEVAVKKLIVGQAVKNASALANPECLEFYNRHPALQNA
eukprot:comp12567_c0_seq1/m.7565 comp12567_c0_seq1/g.7565  ORF comp12567_c0_seq1/g.7565 comp12567_c0_seq1/m.7565 type:complete len:678 (-) comp12567_c0_seq1:825-2858(-)